jgi:hypothetical protein
MPKPKNKSTLKTGVKRPVKKLSKKKETLLEWEAFSRPFKKREKEYFTTIGIIVALLIVTVVFLKEFLLIGVILSFSFVLYVLSAVPPEKIKNKITTEGITSAKHTYSWDQLASFWFSETYKQKTLNLKTTKEFPGQALLLLGEIKEDKVRKLLSCYLKFEKEPPQSFLDNAAQTLIRSFPSRRKNG